MSGPLLRSLPAVLAGPVVDQELDSSAEYFPIITPYYDSLAQISASPVLYEPRTAIRDV